MISKFPMPVLTRREVDKIITDAYNNCSFWMGEANKKRKNGEDAVATDAYVVPWHAPKKEKCGIFEHRQ